MTSTDLNVKVDANTTGFEAAIGRAERSTRRYEDSLASLQADLTTLEKKLDDDIAAALQRQHDAMDKTGKGLMVFGAAIAAGLGMATNEAMKWEAAWTGVTKTVDGSESQMATLEKDLRQLATTLPATHEEIAAVAEAAGQLGVKREAVIGFTKTMIDLSETTNLTADEAATSMARFANIMQTPQDEVDRLGASLVALGNNGASTEAEILSMATRIAGAGAQLGLTEGEVMGIANALSSVGVEAQAGGSAISMVMKDIALEVATGGDRLEDFARISGMSAQEFSTMWGTDAAGALSAFVAGLGNVQASGGSTIKTLADLEITQIRQSDALLRLAGAGDLLAGSLDLGNDAWRENTALLEEAAKRYETTEAKVAIARNTLRDSAIDVGNVLLPALAKLAEVTADVLRAWSDLPGPLKSGMVIIAGLTAGTALLGGAMLVAIPKIAAFRTALAGLETGALKTAGTRLGGVMSLLGGPWGAALMGATAVLGIFAAEHGRAAREIDAFKGTLDETTAAITDSSWQQAIENLSGEGWLEWSEQAGISAEEVVAALTKGGDALDALRAKADAESSEWNPFNSDSWTNDADQFITNIENQRAAIEAAQEEKRRDIDANDALADSTGKAADAQDGTTAAWEDGADAAGDLGDEVKTLGESLSDLSENFLNQRDAGRQVRGSLREVKKALAAYREEHGSLNGAFRKGSASADDFSGMLDDLASDYVRQIETTERLTGSERKTMQAYRESRASLVEVAQQLGMTRGQAERYADQILGTPKEVKTHFDAQTEGAEADLVRLRQLMEDAARNRAARIDITTYFHQRGFQTKGGLQEADGGVVQAYADGGFSSSGQIVQRVPQLREGGGAILWNEPETGWEAYISGKPSMEARNRQVWLEAGKRLGFMGAGRGSGGSAGGSSHGMAPQISLAGLTLRANVDGLGDVMFRVAEDVAGNHRAHDSDRASAHYQGVGVD